MRKFLRSIGLLLIFPAAPVFAVGPLINGNQINPQTAISIATFSVTGAGGMAVTNSVTASSFTASGSGFKGAGTGLTGTAASLTAGNVTTNANLTGPVTSVGNATSIPGPVPQSAVNLSTVTTALAAKAASGANGDITSLTALTTISNSFTVPSPSSGTFGGTLGATGQVHLSTGMTVYFAPNAGFSSAQTSFTPSATVTGSTVSFVVQGTTVACWFSGAVSGTTLSAIIRIGIGVDGSVSKIPGTSSTAGITASEVPATGSEINMSFPPIEFQVSAGASHAFYLGLWSGGGTLTFPGGNQISIGQFGCREVLSR